MSNYYEKKDAKVRMSEELRKLGWTIYGYKADESDSMTDYYSPADWGGIAEKNGYILVVDNRYSSTGREITKYNPNYIYVSEADRNKINSLKNMTVEKGATQGEEDNAKILIDKINKKYSNEGVSKYEVIGHVPAHLGNPTRVMWHIEKDGVLVDKGNALTFIANVPDSRIYDINKMTFTDRYKKVYNWENGERVERDNILEEGTLKDINKFKALLLRIERIANCGNSCGDGTTETENAFQQQNENEKMVLKTFTKKKKVIKPVKVERNFLKVGDYVNYKGRNKTCCYWLVTYVDEKTFNYESTGKKFQKINTCKRYYNHISRLDQYEIFELKEVEEVETIEKWVKVKNTAKKIVNKETKVSKEDIAPVQENTETENQESNTTCKVNFNEDKNGIELSFSDKPSQEIRDNIKELGFRWSKFNKIWYAKDTEAIREKLKEIGLLNADNKEVATDNLNVNVLTLEDIDNLEIKINEADAKRSKENMSFSDYKENSATNEYNSIIDNIKNDIIESNLSDNINVLRLFKRYKVQYANWLNKHYRNGAGHVSVMICGAGHYNMKKHNAYLDREGKLWEEYNKINELKEKIYRYINKAILEAI